MKTTELTGETRILAILALRECKKRGHKMSTWDHGSEWYEHIKMSTCKVCGKSVWINPSPKPNDIDISGEAVALACDD